MDRRGNLLFQKSLRAALACTIALVPPVSHAAINQPAQAVILPPVTSACVSSPFGPRILPNRPLAGTFHNGVDIPTPVGAAVTAVAPGSVIRVQRHGVGGLEILIQHDGFIGVYSHLGLVSPLIAEGRKAIYRGERIATIGRSGLTYGSHLYFGMIVDGHAIDPSPYLGIAPCEMHEVAKPGTRLRPARPLPEQQS